MNEKSVSASPLPSGRTETVYAGCKINLFLFITGKLPNGYLFRRPNRGTS